jgi:hypothetical protein
MILMAEDSSIGKWELVKQVVVCQCGDLSVYEYARLLAAKWGGASVFRVGRKLTGREAHTSNLEVSAFSRKLVAKKHLPALIFELAIGQLHACVNFAFRITLVCGICVAQ